MNCFRIAGGIPLNGEVVIQGSKNAALPIMAATILTDGVTILHRCPRIKDVFLMQHLLESMGCRMRWEQDTLSIDTTGLPKELPEITPVVGGSLGMAARQKSSMRSGSRTISALRCLRERLCRISRIIRTKTSARSMRRRILTASFISAIF